MQLKVIKSDPRASRLTAPDKRYRNDNFGGGYVRACSSHSSPMKICQDCRMSANGRKRKFNSSVIHVVERVAQGPLWVVCSPSEKPIFQEISSCSAMTARGGFRPQAAPQQNLFFRKIQASLTQQRGVDFGQ